MDHDALPSRFKGTRYPQMLTQLEARRDPQRALPDDDPLPPAEHGSATEALGAYQREAAESLALEDDLEIDR